MLRACAGCAIPIPQGGPIRCSDCASDKPTRNGKLHKRFRRAVIARDKECTRCGATEDLVAHHLVSLGALNAYSPASGITVCASCHREVDPHAR